MELRFCESLSLPAGHYILYSSFGCISVCCLVSHIILLIYLIFFPPFFFRFPKLMIKTLMLTYTKMGSSEESPDICVIAKPKVTWDMLLSMSPLSMIEIQDLLVIQLLNKQLTQVSFKEKLLGQYGNYHKFF